MKALQDSSFTIIGTGLMGASLAMGLRGKVRRMYGMDANPGTLVAAKPFFDGISSDLNAVRDSDVIILATPIRAILSVLGTIHSYAKPGALIIDLGSTKSMIVTAMNTLPESLLAIGGHPMCGKESSGPGAADSTMYHRAKFVLCPTERTTPEALAFAQGLVSTIGAISVILNAEEHDAAVALISHLPYLVSAGLVGNVMDHQGNVDDFGTAWQLAASGFRDTSRLAGSDVTMMGDTLATNRVAVLRAIEGYQSVLETMHKQLLAGEDVDLRASLEAIREARNGWFARFQTGSKT